MTIQGCSSTLSNCCALAIGSTVLTALCGVVYKTKSAHGYLRTSLDTLFSKNAVMVHLIEDLHGGLINEVNLKMMYDESAPGSKLRQLAVDQILYDAKCGQLEDCEQPYIDLADIMEEFAKDITKVCLRMVGRDFKDPAMQREKYLGDPTFEIDAS